jgi:hypothetical protein
MSNGHKLELIRREDGGLFLNYWGWMEGEDTLWEIDPDGKVYNTMILGNEYEGKLEANLGQDLLKLMDALDRQMRRHGYDPKTGLRIPKDES